MNDFEWLHEARQRDPLSFDEAELRDARRRMSESPELCELILGDATLAPLEPDVGPPYQPKPVTGHG